MSDVWYGPHEAPDTYRHICDLGGGSEGRVVEAEVSLGELSVDRVAMKIMEPTGDPDSAVEWRDRCRQLLINIDHRGIVRVRDVFLGPPPHRQKTVTYSEPTERGTADPGPADREQGAAESWRYVVMTRIAGRELHDWLDRGLRQDPDMSLPERLRPLLPVAEALDAMHDGPEHRGPVVHGDVKPANIIVDEHGSGVLVDLGLTRLVRGTGGFGHTPPYAAPELFQDGALCTPETDRFAFISTVVHLVLGRTPPTTTRGPDLPRIDHLLRGHPVFANRPQLARDLIEALRAAPDQRPTSMRDWLNRLTDSATIIGAGATATVPTHADGWVRRVARQYRDPVWWAYAALLCGLSGTSLHLTDHPTLFVAPVAAATGLAAHLVAAATAARSDPAPA